LTKTRNAAADFAKSPERPSLNPDNADSSPLQYQAERFYNYPKEYPNYTMGEKREQPIEQKPGPGEYEVDSPLTKTRAPACQISPSKSMSLQKSTLGSKRSTRSGASKKAKPTTSVQKYRMKF